MIDLSETIDKLAISVVTQKKEQTTHELDNFFQPIVKNVEITSERAQTGLFDSTGLEDFNAHFIPFIKNSKSISSMMFANQFGDEIMLLQQDSSWTNRVTQKGSAIELPTKYQWQFNQGILTPIKQWKDEKAYSPLTRPWYEEAIQTNENISWTEPYTFFTTKEPGITVSKKWTNRNKDTCVFGFDILLSDISKFTTQLEISEHGKAFILTEDDKVLGLPKDQKFTNKDSLNATILRSIHEIGIPSLLAAKREWENVNKVKGCFGFEFENVKWWGSLNEYKLGNNTFLIGVIAPESDFLSAIQQTRLMILGGFIIIFLFTIMILRTYRQIRKANLALVDKNEEIEKQRDYARKQKIIADEQKMIVEEKNHEILDSINYAKRIQSAILPPQKLVKEYLPKSFILYKPKDIVAGDFYWMEHVALHPSTPLRAQGYLILFAAADCTGHGVPGAMVSVVCNNGLNRAVREYGLTDPGEILDKTREIVIQEFEKSEEEVKDGMDIALCSLEFLVPNSTINNSFTDDNTKEQETKATLKYAGAHNPLWIIRNGELIETKADKQPIGKFDKLQPYTTHHFDLQKNDTIYIFSDGYVDQFGGERGKKYKSIRLKSFILSIYNQPMEKQKELLHLEFEKWRGKIEQIDDVCFIGVRI